jgi:mRNA interferase RelE/StbE
VDRFEVILAPKALKFYRKCPKELAERLDQCFQGLGANPFFGPDIKVLKTQDKLYRYRVGGYRVIYEINKTDKKVGILLIAPRPSVYRNI